MVVHKKMERGIHKPKLLHFDNLGTGRAVASGVRIYGASPDVVPVPEPDGELPSELLGALLFDGSPVLGLSLLVLGGLLEGLG